ncbi:MAG: hypothetical protein HRT47_04405 [Candidatus Caenarcaniphilales bacterium]|nr:hypothetical protein [Candidatus Caenarcaniphilales bacterium]
MFTDYGKLAKTLVQELTQSSLGSAVTEMNNNIKQITQDIQGLKEAKDARPAQVVELSNQMPEPNFKALVQNELKNAVDKIWKHTSAEYKESALNG